MMQPYGREMYPMMYPIPMAQPMMGPGAVMPHMGMPPMQGMMPAPMQGPQERPPMLELPADKDLLGEYLFPLVEKENPQNASKITGMLLEMEVDQIHSIIRDPGQLNKWMAEALKVRHTHKRIGPRQPCRQLTRCT